MELLQLNPNASVILAGDFNKLNVAEISERTGLLTSVNSPTRGAKTLDMIMTSVPQQLSVRTDYKAILATTKGGVRDRAKKSWTYISMGHNRGRHHGLLIHPGDSRRSRRGSGNCTRKSIKYLELMPVAIEAFCLLNREGLVFLSDTGSRLSNTTSETRETSSCSRHSDGATFIPWEGAIALPWMPLLLTFWHNLITPDQLRLQMLLLRSQQTEKHPNTLPF